MMSVVGAVGVAGAAGLDGVAAGASLAGVVDPGMMRRRGCEEGEEGTM